jgi:hypothetical protein
MVMPKACIGGVISSVLTSEGSAGLPAIFGASVTVAVVAVPHKNPDGSNVKDTRT